MEKQLSQGIQFFIKCWNSK